jgi:outer membrane protein OmpU
MNIKKVGLTALAGSLVATSAFAGSLTLSGGAKISYTSSSGTQDSGDTAGRFAMDQEISASGSGELDNGFVISLSHGMSGEETAKSDTSSLTLDMGDMGTLSYSDADQHGGLAGLEDFMPMAYEQANDGIGGSATAIMAKQPSGQGFGYDVSVGGASVSIGFSDNIGASADRTDGEIDTSSAGATSSSSLAISYDVSDALTVKAGAGSEGQSDGKEIDHTTVGFTYSFGPAKVGYQLNDEDDSAAGGTDLETEIYGISFMINDNFSVSYAEHNTDKANATTDQEINSIQASYSMGGMSINLKESEGTGIAATANQNHDATEILVSFAF